MSKNTIDLIISFETKQILKSTKELEKITYINQIETSLNHIINLPVEEIANIIFDQYKNIKKLKQKKEKITLNEEQIKGQLDFLRKVHLAISTKLSNLEFREMILLLLHHYFLNNNSSAN